VVESLPSKYEALGSNPSIEKAKQNKKHRKVSRPPGWRTGRRALLPSPSKEHPLTPPMPLIPLGVFPYPSWDRGWGTECVTAQTSSHSDTSGCNQTGSQVTEEGGEDSQMTSNRPHCKRQGSLRVGEKRPSFSYSMS
jgi:hypothetical protein